MVGNQAVALRGSFELPHLIDRQYFVNQARHPCAAHGFGQHIGAAIGQNRATHTYGLEVLQDLFVFFKRFKLGILVHQLFLFGWREFKFQSLAGVLQAKTRQIPKRLVVPAAQGVHRIAQGHQAAVLDLFIAPQH